MSVALCSSLPTPPYQTMTDRYQIISPMTSASAGSFFRGWDKHQNRDVSIQRVKVEGEAAEEAQREARTLYGLRHPNIVTIFEYGKEDDGVYLVREMVKGKSLENLVAQRPLNDKEFNTLVLQTLSALDTAHTSGLIHRQLHPGTLMVPWSAENKFSIKITDFSLGAPFDPAVPRSLEAEQSMAPEQFGQAPVTLRTDLYSLGTIFYFALTQKQAFQGKHSADVVIAHLYHRFVPLAELRPDLSPVLCSWVERLMKQNPAERPASAEEALQMYKMIPDDDVVVAAPVIEEAVAPILEIEEEEEPVAAAVAEEDEAVAEAEEEEAPQAQAHELEVEEPVLEAATAEPEIAEEEETVVFAKSAPVMAPASYERATVVRPEVNAPQRSRMSAMNLIIVAFVVILVGMFGLVSYLKYSSQDDRLQRLAELSQGEGPQGSDLDVRMLFDFLEEREHQVAAAAALSKLQGADSMIIGHVGETTTDSAALKLIEVIGQRGLRAAFEKVLPLTSARSQDMRKAAWTTLAKITDDANLPRLLAVIDGSSPRDSDLIGDSIVAAIKSAGDQAQASRVAFEGYRAAKDSASRTILLNVLTRVGGGPETLALIAAAISDPAEDVRRTATILLAEYPTHDPLSAITSRFPEEPDPSCRAYLLLAAQELVSKPGGSSQENLARHVQSLYANAKTEDEKDRALTAVSRVVAPSTVTFYQDYANQDDPSLRREAMALSSAFEKRLLRVVAVPPGAVSGALPAAQADYTLGGSITVENEVLSNWASESDWASWLVQIPTNGNYEVVIYQAHTGTATGTYEVLFAGQTKITAVVKTAGASDFKGFVVGQFSVSEPGTYKLIVRPKKIPVGEELFRVQKLSIKPL